MKKKKLSIFCAVLYLIFLFVLPFYSFEAGGKENFSLLSDLRLVFFALFFLGLLMIICGLFPSDIPAIIMGFAALAITVGFAFFGEHMSPELSIIIKTIRMRGLEIEIIGIGGIAMTVSAACYFLTACLHKKTSNVLGGYLDAANSIQNNQAQHTGNSFSNENY